MLYTFGFAMPVVLYAVALTVGVPQGAAGTPQSNSSYLKGEWSDACPCKVPCPCWKTGQSSVEKCTNFHLYLIPEGRYAGKTLRNTAFVVVNVSHVSRGRPLPTVSYIELGASPVERTAVSAFLREVYPGAHIPLHRKSIKFKSTATKHLATISGLLTYEVAFPNAGSSKKPVESVSSYLYPWLSEPQQGETTRVAFQGNRSNVKYSGTNALRARFLYRFRKE